MKKLDKVFRSANLLIFPELESTWLLYNNSLSSLKDSKKRIAELKGSCNELKKNKKIEKSILKAEKQRLKEAALVHQRLLQVCNDFEASLKNWVSLFLRQHNLQEQEKRIKKLEQLFMKYGALPDKSQRKAATKKMSKSSSDSRSENKKNGKVAGKPSTTATTLIKQTAKKPKKTDTVQKTDKFEDLKKIAGIGPKIEMLLQEAGIHTYSDLSSTDYETLTGILSKAGPRFSLADPAKWPELAAKFLEK